MLESNQQALLNAIIANPDDDNPRLVYADWLEERDECNICPKCKDERFRGYFGDASIADAYTIELAERKCRNCNGTGFVQNGYAERAEFIRLQCRNKSLNRSSREMDLGHINRIHWFGADDTWSFSLIANYKPTNDPSRCKIVRRGFIDEVHLTTADFMKHCYDIASKHPVRRWVLTDFEIWVESRHGLPSIWSGDYFNNNPRVADVPSPVFKRLKGKGEFATHVIYKTEQELYADLEQACFHEARSELAFIKQEIGQTEGIKCH